MSRPVINLHLGDCMEAMAKMPDKAYDLAIVDPPYGIGASNPSKKPEKVRQKNGSLLYVKQYKSRKLNWDNSVPSVEFFNELKRVSKNQIIWGANYFGLIGGMLVWDKLNGSSDQYDAEIAWLSWTKEVRTVYYMWSGMFQGKQISSSIHDALEQDGNKKNNEKRIHETQKPVKLYKWLLHNYAKEGDKILDTHGGSMSIALACHDMNFDLDLWELDPEYYQKGVERFNQHKAQLRMF